MSLSMCDSMIKWPVIAIGCMICHGIFANSPYILSIKIDFVVGTGSIFDVVSQSREMRPLEISLLVPLSLVCRASVQLNRSGPAILLNASGSMAAV